MKDRHECQGRIGKPTEHDRREDQEEEGAMDVINIDKKSREKEKDGNVKERRECLDNPWKVVFYHTFCEKRPNARTIVELATVILGSKEITTGPLLEKGGQKSA
jgi:hypothetical protein